jgi:hypothetical protein
MQLIGLHKEKRDCPLKLLYMKRVDAVIARRHLKRTLLALAIIAFVVYLIFRPDELTLHHLVFRVVLPSFNLPIYY